jgi:hypothetical protein
LEAYDELVALKPDIVTLSLAYTATVDRCPDIASQILSRAVTTFTKDANATKGAAIHGLERVNGKK